MDKTYEVRTFQSKVELRTEEGKASVLLGKILVNTRSIDLGGFVEEIAPGAFENIMNNDVRALVNHNSDLVLGRTKVGTLRMAISEAGSLDYEVDLPNTSYSNDLQESIRRGDIDGTSFAFRIAPDGVKWIDDNGKPVRRILKFLELRDVSPVVYPAYPEMSVSLRDEFNAFKKSQDKVDPNDDLAYYERKTHIAKIK